MCLRIAGLVIGFFVIWKCSVATGTESRWLDSTSGDWTDGTRWSTSPNFPQNNQPSPGIGYDVLLDNPGDYQVRLAQDATVDSIDIRSGTLFFDRQSFGPRPTLQADRILVGPDGRLEVNDGRIETSQLEVDGTADLKNEAIFIGTTISGSGNFQAEYLWLVDGTLRVPVTPQNGLRAGGTLTLDNITLAPNGLTFAEADGTFGGDHQLAGTGLIDLQFDPPDPSRLVGSISSDGNLTIGNDITIRMPSIERASAGIYGRTFTNNGTILVGVDGDGYGDYWLNSERIVNNGQITVDASLRIRVINDDVAFINPGVIRVGPRGRLTLDGRFDSLDQLSNIQLDNPGDPYSLLLLGTYDNSGSVLNLDAFPLPKTDLFVGILQGGRIEGTAAPDGYRLAPEGSALHLQDVTLATHILATSGMNVTGQLRLDGGSVTGSIGFFTPNSVLAGTGIVRLPETSRLESSQLLIEEGIEIFADSQTTITARTNRGSIHVNGYSDIQIAQNQGSVTIDAGPQVVRYGRNDVARWENTGTIDLRSSALELVGNYDSSSIGNLLRGEDTSIVYGGVYQNTNQTLVLESRDSFQGTMIGGTVVSTAARAVLDGALRNRVTLRGQFRQVGPQILADEGLVLDQADLIITGDLNVSNELGGVGVLRLEDGDVVLRDGAAIGPSVEIISQSGQPSIRGLLESTQPVLVPGGNLYIEQWINHGGAVISNSAGLFVGSATAANSPSWTIQDQGRVSINGSYAMTSGETMAIQIAGNRTEPVFAAGE
ncbi:MAG: hypothetical protein R3C28_02340 [Pirellulaceae bacterium]